LVSELPSSTVVVAIRGDEPVRYPVWESRESSGGGLYVKGGQLPVEPRIYIQVGKEIELSLHNPSKKFLQAVSPVGT
jgi:hypothetical protein